MTKLSVICTVYNGEEYVDRGVPSILNQDYDGKIDFVLVDDGSTDATPELLRTLEQRYSHVRAFFPGRLGRASALNYAVEQAEGELIAQQDFDDVSFPERLRLQISHIERRPEVGIVGGHCEIEDENRGERYVRRAPLGHSQVIKTMGRYIPFAHTLIMFRKEAWEEVGGYPNLNTAIDFGFMLRVAGKGWLFEGIDEVLGRHHKHADSFWHREFSYFRRQAVLARLQAKAIATLDLPVWTYIYPLGRFVYPVLPQGTKRMVRRVLGGASETSIENEGNSVWE